ncbi:MAG: N-acetylmuramoyl-L-alanine amidase [Acidimicrobiia bacterium]|nr:N-acetylmuramoyl-L-alanine amidase [Acidimicrobiia bacterium]
MSLPSHRTEPGSPRLDDDGGDPAAPARSGRLGRRGFLASGGGALAWVAMSGLPFAPRATTAPGLESARLALIDPVVGYRANGVAPTVGPGWTTRAALPIPGQMVTMQWQGSAHARLSIRSHTPRAGWTAWVAAETHEDEGPDHTSAEFTGRSGIGPIWVGDGTDEVELRIEEGNLTALELDTLRSTEPSRGLFGLDAAAAAPAWPNIYPRSTWGAGPWMAGQGGCAPQPIDPGRLRLAIVHHTVSTNSYSAAEARSLIRGIYHYHVNSNGWCDIAYNFFIDKYGNIYEGRTGSIDGPVIGGHAAGFNTGSVGIALLGQYNSGSSPAASGVSSAQRAALRRLTSWIFGEYGIDAGARVWVESLGGSRYPRGTPVHLSTISTHRDVGQTACPGNNAISTLPTLRTQVQRDVAFSAPTKGRWAPQPNGPAMVTLDAFGGVHPGGSKQPIRGGGPYWANWKIARGIMLNDDGSGYVADGYGGVHSFAGAPRVTPSAYFTGRDLARGITPGPTPGSGYVLDRSGELHPFGGAPRAPISSKWPGEWNVAIAAVSNRSGLGGYVLDAFGALHAWGNAPKATGITGYWHGWRIARSVALRADGTSGWVLDAYGGLHPFGGAPRVASPFYRAGQDRYRQAIASNTSAGGWVLSSDGEIFSFGNAPNITHNATFTGLGIAIQLAVAPSDRGAVA